MCTVEEESAVSAPSDKQKLVPRLRRIVAACFIAIVLVDEAGGQSGIITTIAGGIRDNVPATTVRLRSPRGVAVDGAGNLYIADTDGNRVRRVDTRGIVATVAGNGQLSPFPSDGALATSAAISPWAVAVDTLGVPYISDPINARIWRINIDGTIATVAGNGMQGYSGDGGPATSASIYPGTGLVVDATGNIYFAEGNNVRVRRVDTSGIITTVAGNGVQDSAGPGDGGPATSASFFVPSGLALDGLGNLYIADKSSRVRRVGPDGIINTIAGTAVGGSSGDGGPAARAMLNGPSSVATDAIANLYIFERFRIRRVDQDGIIHTIAGSGAAGFSGDGGPATQAKFSIEAQGMAFDAPGNLYIADTGNDRVRMVDLAGTINTVAGTGVGDGGLATDADVSAPTGVVVDASGNVYFADSGNHRIRRIDPSGVITTVAGNGDSSSYVGDGSDGRAATATGVCACGDLVLDRAGNLLFAESQRIRKVDVNGIITTVEGSTAVYGNRFAVDDSGNFFIADRPNNKVWRIDASGAVQLAAGNGQSEFSGDGGPAINAGLSAVGVAVDKSGNLYIADNRHIRRVDAAGIISTIAGNGSPRSSGDGGPATDAGMAPAAITADGRGNLYFIEAGEQTVRKVDGHGIISTIAGNGIQGFSGDGGPAIKASLNNPRSLFVDNHGNVYIADTGNHRVRKVTTSAGSGPLISSVGNVNAASFIGGPVAPGEIVSIFGLNIGPTDGVGARLNAAGRVDMTLADTQVMFDGVPAPLFFVRSDQINAQVPYSVSGKSASQLRIAHQGQSSNEVTISVSDAAPGIFTYGDGSNRAIVLNQDGTRNSASNPIPPGDVVVFYATGEGQTVPPGVDGKLAEEPYPRPVLPVAVKIGGRDAEVLFAGGAPHFAGLLQVNARVPADITSSANVTLLFGIGTMQSQPGVTLAVGLEPFPSPMDDDFSDNVLSTEKWFMNIDPSGTGTIIEQNQRMEMTHFKSGQSYLGLGSRCTVGGDFDVRVHYALLNWPPQNFHTVRLATHDLTPASFGHIGIYRNSYADENYEFRADRVIHVATTDMSGTIRLTRTGSMVSGYRWDGDQFVLLGSATVSTNATAFVLDTSTPNTAAPGGVAIAFDDFRVKADSVSCPP